MRAQLTNELEASLLRELCRHWREVNHTFFKNALRQPVIRLDDSSATLGRWELHSRSISLSRAFVMEAKWGSVIEVLKHEMAHQYVHEVLGATDETAHGPAFASTCARMGIDRAASGVPEPGDDAHDRGRLRQRVAALLALAESPNRHEAENAAALAQRLMLKHNIASSQQPSRRHYGFTQLGSPKGRIQEHEHILAAIMADHFFVEAIWVPAYRPLDGKRGSVLEICGTPENLEIAAYVHGFLSETAERLWQRHRRERQIAGNRDRRGYLAGVMEGFRERLSNDKRQHARQGLVWVGDADLEQYHRARHPHVRSVRIGGHGPSDARRSGREAGRNIVLHRGVRAGSQSRGRLLTSGRK